MSLSQNEKQSYLYRTSHRLFQGLMHGIRTAYLAKVVKYYPKKHTADIEPLAELPNGQKMAQYLDVPVAENCYMIDEMLERFKPDYKATDTNSTIGAHDGVPAHEHSNFVSHYPKKKLMRAGVPVLVIVLDGDADNWEGGRSVKNYTPNSTRMHDRNDSVIVAVLGGDFTNG